jgi:wyosine [tRNA(Phe)-imidazoG37] synthetase (radical SAM superfamily)
MIMDEFRIDSHKLMLHPRRVADWLDGRNIAPLYMEISPSGACNHRCRFCGLDFMGYKPRFLPLEVMKERFQEMAAAGLKSVMFAGEGEPFLHRNMGPMARDAKSAGLDAAFTTNAVNLRPETAKMVLPASSWIKVSCNAGTAKTYALVHGTQEKDFSVMLSNMEEAARLRQQEGYACTLGFQMLLLPENQAEAVGLAQTVRDLGADYLVIKPYSQHPQSRTREYAAVSYADLDGLAQSLDALNTDGFSVIFRHGAMRRLRNGRKQYDRCLALPFWSYMDAGGGIWGCSVFLGDERFAYGNILESSFTEIWNGAKRRDSLVWCAAHLDAQDCRLNCRMDPVNAYLWELAHPGGHDNFI